MGSPRFAGEQTRFLVTTIAVFYGDRKLGRRASRLNDPINMKNARDYEATRLPR